uniref:Putative udp-gal:glucosylceramide beta-14-galactosyltransferase n=1 Tax=Amblyomma cajennense TaxID=34607 RepID=A0A023FQA8_AMBCJ
MGIPASTSTAETRMGHGTAAAVRLFARSNVAKTFVAMALCFALVHWCFDVDQIREHALRLVSKGHPRKHEEAGSAEDKRVSSQTTQKTSPTIRVPDDVISDGHRANKSLDNLCPLIPPSLVGYIPVKTDVTSVEAVESEFPNLQAGGHFQPEGCTSRHRVAILVPYRDRAAHLPVFLYNLHRVLSRQQIDYGIFVIEQGDKLGFNRAKLLNIGFVESTALYDFQCFVFHDVDLVPMDDRNVYTCPEQPRHMSVMRNDTSMVFYPLFFGGVSAVSKEHMLRVNGYSNA